MDSTQWYCDRCGYHGSVDHSSDADIITVAMQTQDDHSFTSPACGNGELVRVWTSAHHYSIKRKPPALSPALPDQPATIQVRLVQRGDMPPILSGKADLLEDASPDSGVNDE